MRRVSYLLALTLACLPEAATALAQDETVSCSDGDLYLVGIGAGESGGVGFRTQIQLRNVGDRPLASRLLMFSDAGIPWAASLSAAFTGETEGEYDLAGGAATFEIPSHSGLILTLQSQDNHPPGWACLANHPDLVSRTEFQISSLGDSTLEEFGYSVEKIAEIRPVRLSRHFLVPIHYLAGGRLHSTAFAAVNPTAGTGAIRAVLSPGTSGRSIERTFTLGPGQSLADYWDHFFSVAHPQMLGLEHWEVAEIRAEFPIAVTVQQTLDGFPVSGTDAVPRDSEGAAVAADFGKEVELSIGETATFGTDLSLEFWNVPADSRCPTDGLVVCVWQGEAVIDLKVQEVSTGSSSVRLSNYGTRNTAVVGDFRIDLISVAPPAASNRSIAMEDYRIRLLVQRTAAD